MKKDNKVAENQSIIHVTIPNRVNLNDLSIEEKETIEKSLGEPERTKTLMQIAVENVKAFNIGLELVTQINFLFEKYKGDLSKVSNPTVSEEQKIVMIILMLYDVYITTDFGIGFLHDSAYIFEKYWQKVDIPLITKFLEMVAEKAGIKGIDAQQPLFRKKLYEQFMATFQLNVDKKRDKVLINFPQGTLVIDFKNNKKKILREFRKDDFLFDCREFDYDPEAKTTLYFQNFLDRVLPDKASQKVLLENWGYLFDQTLNLQTCLILLGKGANGKSLCRTIVEKLVGKANICGYTIQNLCDQTGYYRAELENKLVCYPDEIGTGKYDADTFKNLISGGDIGVRPPYGRPYMLRNTCKFIINANSLPVAQIVHAFFRRLIAIPFNIIITKKEQDPFLAEKICENDLSAIFNMALEGLERLHEKQQFTESELIAGVLERYQRDSDSVSSFLHDENWEISPMKSIMLKELYGLYRQYCVESGYNSICANKTFSERLRDRGFCVKEGTNHYNYVWCQKKVSGQPIVKSDIKSILLDLDANNN